MELGFSDGSSCQALQCRSSCHCMTAKLRNQTRRAFLETGSPAKSLSTKTVIVSTCSCLRKRNAVRDFPNQVSCCTLQRNEVEVTRFTHSLGKRHCSFCQIKPVLGQIRKSHACRSVTCCIFFIQNLTLPTIRHSRPCLAVSLSRYSHGRGFRIAFRFINDEWCVPQVRFNVQVFVLFDLSQLETHGSSTKYLSHLNHPKRSVPMSSLCIWT